MENMNVINKQSTGVTLVELLVAVAVSLILLLGVGSVYFNSKRTYQVQEEFAHMQEGSRIALRFMIEDIKSAGYLGCLRNSNRNNFQNLLEPDGDLIALALMGSFTLGVEGIEANASGPTNVVDLAAPPAGWDRAIPGFITRAPLAGSDILIVRHAAGAGALLAAANDNASVWLAHDGSVPAIDNTTGVDCHSATGICVGQILLLSDCTKSRVFQVTAMQQAGPGIQLAHETTADSAGGIEPGNRELARGSTIRSGYG